MRLYVIEGETSEIKALMAQLVRDDPPPAALPPVPLAAPPAPLPVSTAVEKPPIINGNGKPSHKAKTPPPAGKAPARPHGLQNRILDLVRATTQGMSSHELAQALNHDPRNLYKACAELRQKQLLVRDDQRAVWLAVAQA